MRTLLPPPDQDLSGVAQVLSFGCSEQLLSFFNDYACYYHEVFVLDLLPGAQLHHLTQVGLSSHIGVYPGVGRSMSGPTGSSWNQQHSDQDLSRPGASRESVGLLWVVRTGSGSSMGRILA